MAGMRVFVPYFGALLLPNLVMLACAVKVKGGIALLAITLVSTAVCIWVSVCMSLLASAFSKRASAATGLAYLFCATALFLGFYVMLLIGVFFVGLGPADEIDSFFGLMITSPMLGFGLNMTEEMPGDPLTSFWIANVVLCTIWPLGILALATHRWKETWERDRT
jgi:glucan phosphoethanolaminetransferase (alkaline phosphatase superfamily)